MTAHPLDLDLMAYVEDLMANRGEDVRIASHVASCSLCRLKVRRLIDDTHPGEWR